MIGAEGILAKMVTFLITSLFLLGFLGIAVYLWQKPSSRAQTEVLLPPPFEPRGLFAADGLSDSAIENPESKGRPLDAELRASLLERGRQGDKAVLGELHLQGDHEFYDQALDLLLAQSDSDGKILSLISYVTRNELPVNGNLARRFIGSWKSSPDRSSTAKMLHIAALSDDAAIYQAAVEAALQCWRNGDLPEVSPPELRAILEGEFWILSSPARNSGAGFLLKRTLATARRELKPDS